MTQMLLAQITFGGDTEKDERDAQKDIAESYLAALLKNGQIYGTHLVAWSGGTLNVYAQIPRPDSLDERHHSDWGLRDLEAVANSFGQRPKYFVIDDDVPERFPTWQSSSSLYLFTHALDDSSPVCCGDTGRPIPLYLIPIPQEKRESLYFWSRSYNYHDNIWFGSGTLEIPTYTQLADPNSELSNNGRKLCSTIEQATGIPTFYFMHRYWGRIDGESMRPCPVCGGQWNQSEVRYDRTPFHQFHFKCETCRLVSCCGDLCDNAEYAEIGDHPKAA